MKSESTRFRALLVRGGILTAALALGCGPAQVGERPAGAGAGSPAFDVVIYVLDACRPDRMGAYGYPRPTTPAIDALAADSEAVVYTRHYVAGNWTKPATASLFTGRHVHQHGVVNLDTEVEGWRYRSQILADGFVTLAESLREAGFTTFGLVTSDHLTPRYGFDQGFDAYFDPNTLRVGDEGRVSKLLDLVSDLDGPYFAYVHQNACHHPFPPRDRDRDFMAEFGFDYDEASRRAAGVDFSTVEIHRAINQEGKQLTAEDARFLSLVYDAKLRTVDREVVAPMIEGLRRAGRWDRTLFILTADHGEELYEHRGYAHAHTLWEEVIRVPLIVKFPRGLRPSTLPRRVDALTSNVDFFPTLLELVGREIPEGLVGRSLLDPPADRFILSQGFTNLAAESLTQWAVIEGWDKLIESWGIPARLFDLETDPGETRDLAASRPERVAALTALGEGTTAGGIATEAPEIETELSPEAVERLRSLGYLD